MKYMLLTYLDEKAWMNLSEVEQAEQMALCAPHVQKLVASGKLLGGAPLHPTSTATTLRMQGGKRLMTDGPFAETREQLGGYTIFEAENLDDALAMASGFLSPESKVPVSLEVRPIVDFPDAPAVK
ncbi:MAG: YciI family protein [Labilithrix sp.]|nr:YciI family protein [Labilithrix sp.]MBX3224124.1 YciI family protein [Labilithrix sp.]